MTQVATPKETYPGLAYDQLLANMGGSTELLNRLALLFLEQHGSDHARIVQALELHDWTQAKFLTHTLRGTAANIGGMAVHDAAYQLEILLEDGDGFCPAALTNLQDAMSEFVASLQRLISETSRP